MAVGWDTVLLAHRQIWQFVCRHLVIQEEQPEFRASIHPWLDYNVCKPFILGDHPVGARGNARPAQSGKRFVNLVILYVDVPMPCWVVIGIQFGKSEFLSNA